MLNYSDMNNPQEMIGKVKEILAAASQRAELDQLLAQFETRGLDKYLLPAEKQFLGQAKAELVGLAQSTPLAPTPAPVPTPAPIVATAPAQEPAPAAPAEPEPPKGSVEHDFWALPSWAKAIVQAQPKDDQDTMTMDLQNAIQSVGEERAQQMVAKLAAPATAGPAKSAAHAQRLEGYSQTFANAN